MLVDCLDSVTNLYSNWVLMTDLAPSYAQLSCNSFGTYQFLIGLHMASFNKNPRYFSKLLFIAPSNWLKFFLLSFLQLPSYLFFIVDGIQYRSSFAEWVVQFNCNSMATDDRLSVFTLIQQKKFSVPSLSTLFFSSIWLERELSDFSGLNFVGLSDTRRLLLDYFDVRCSWQTHIGNDKNYNNNFYDIFLNF